MTKQLSLPLFSRIKPRNPRTILRHVAKCGAVPCGDNSGDVLVLVPARLWDEIRAANERAKQ